MSSYNKTNERYDRATIVPISVCPGLTVFSSLLLCFHSESIDGVDSKGDSGSNDSEVVHNRAETIFDA